MEAYRTLLNDLDAQIEQGLGLFEKKWEKALDVPEEQETEEETKTKLYATVPGLGPQSFFQKAQSRLVNFRNSLTNIVAPLPEKLPDARLQHLKNLQPKKETLTLPPELQTFQQQGNELIENGKAEEYLGKLDKLTNRGGTRRKRKGPTGNRTRIAGFKVLSAKPLHHKTKK